jgi:hypothetical protein
MSKKRRPLSKNLAASTELKSRRHSCRFGSEHQHRAIRDQPDAGQGVGHDK